MRTHPRRWTIPLVLTDFRMPPSRTDEGVQFAARLRKSNAAIADSLVLSKRAVEKQISSIFMKLGLADADDVSKRVKAALVFLAEAGGPG